VSVLSLVDSSPLPIRVMVLDDESAICRAVQRNLTSDQRFRVEWADEVAPVIARLQAGSVDWDVAILDVGLRGDIDGIEMLHRFRRASAMTSVVMMSGDDRASTATKCLRAGAFHYITKPVKIPELSEVVRQAASHGWMLRASTGPQRNVGAVDVSSALLGHSPAIHRLRDRIQTFAMQSLTTPILIQGETGTGKELVARELHDRSDRRQRPFVVVNCGAIAEGLIDTELFGHSRGAFTGATSDRLGLFEAANGGTLFLDEIGDLPLSAQARLLRVLQEREVRPVGANTTRPIDVRVVAATHVDLDTAVAQGRFRQDLFYRLDVIRLTIPPLRDRIEDVPELAAHFLRKHVRSAEPPPQLDRSTLDVLSGFHWPGNVRQLENWMLSALTFRCGETIYPDALPTAQSQIAAAVTAWAPASEDDIEPLEAIGNHPPVEVTKSEVVAGELSVWTFTREYFDRALATGLEPMPEAKRKAAWLFEQVYLECALTLADGSVRKAASAAGIDRANFRRLLRAHSINATDYRPDGSKRRS
jgi:DNA-binding NtrC family response regulator